VVFIYGRGPTRLVSTRVVELLYSEQHMDDFWKEVLKTCSLCVSFSAMFAEDGEDLSARPVHRGDGQTLLEEATRTPYQCQ
jgi:hypothetical protein